MMWYYHGNPIKIDRGHSLNDKLRELGVTEEQVRRLSDIGLSSDNACCDRLFSFEPWIEPDYDVGTMEILSYSVLMPERKRSTVEDTYITEIGHEWQHFYYCPFCGQKLRRKAE